MKWAGCRAKFNALRLNAIGLHGCLRAANPHPTGSFNHQRSLIVISFPVAAFDLKRTGDLQEPRSSASVKQPESEYSRDDQIDRYNEIEKPGHD